jgi:hypothetical protein
VTRISIIATLVLGLAILAGSAAATSLNHRQDQALANRLTLHLTDMPTGWRVEPSSKSGSRCEVIKLVKAGAQAETGFSKRPDLVFSKASVFSTVAVSKRTYTDLANNLLGCLLIIPDVTYVSIGSTSFPHFGDQSKAWGLQGKIQGVDLYYDIIVVRIQRAVAIYLFRGIGSGDSIQEVRLVRKATARA